MTQPAFKGTLLLLQNRTRRDPDSYREEFKAQLEHFDALTKTIASSPQQHSNPQYIAVLNYVCHVAHCFPKDVQHVGDVLVRILQTTKASLHPETRIAFVKCLMLLRAKDLIAPDITLPVFFELLQLRDKTLRKMILSHIVGDVRKANMPGTKNGASVNKKAQSFLFKVMEEDDAVQARCAQLVMIDLYRRMVWCDERTVQVLTRACFSKHTVILRTALRFFLMQMPKISSVDDDDDDEEERDPGRKISKMKQKLKIVKKTKYRERVLDRKVKSAQKRYSKELREEEAIAKQHVDPIRLLKDPHQFAEQLLTKLQKTSERFDIRILFLSVISRVVSEHEVVLLPLYSFLERYMEPSQLHSTQLLALSATCVHRMIPPDALEPLLKAIANHFVSDRSSPDAITIGINTIREICKRQPLAMNPTLLADLAEYKSQRGDRGVMMAARSLIQLYRDIQPELLPAKLRGSKAGPNESKGPIRFGAPSPLSDIPGLELLLQAEADGEADGLLSGTAGSDESDSSSSSDGSWVDVSSDSDGEIQVDDSDKESIDMSDDDDEVPQLVAVKAKPAAKQATSSSSPVLTVKKSATTGKVSAVHNDEDDIWLEDDEEAEDLSKPPKAVATSEARGAPAKKKSRKEKEIVAEEEDDDDEETDEEESEWDSDEWELCSNEEDSDEEDDEEDDDDEECDDDDEEDDDKDEDEESDEAPEGQSIAQALAAHSEGDSEWFMDTDRRSSASTSKVSTTNKSTASNVSLSATRILTDEDFEKIRKLQKQHGDHRSLRGKQADQEARQKRQEAIVHGISNDLAAHDIEQFTVKKRAVDKEDKIAKAQELRSSKSKYEARKKKKSKLHSTHGEHSKRGKLFQMTKRSHRVAEKLKMSVEDRQDRKKDMKKKDVKFRIKRGWKA